MLEALAVGVPVISTAKGVEGLDVAPGQHVLVGSEPAELARLAASVHDGDGFDLVACARDLVVDRYSWPVVEAAVADHVAALAVPVRRRVSAGGPGGGPSSRR